LCCRLLSETHYLLAISHLYNSTEDGKDKKAEKKAALEQYIISKDILTMALTECADDDRAEAQDTLDVLLETITALQNEIRLMVGCS
jgi:ADP-glucose pyrophosphorylase